MVARLVRDQEVACSNHVSSTNKSGVFQSKPRFFLQKCHFRKVAPKFCPQIFDLLHGGLHGVRSERGSPNGNGRPPIAALFEAQTPDRAEHHSLSALRAIRRALQKTSRRGSPHFQWIETLRGGFRSALAVIMAAPEGAAPFPLPHAHGNADFLCHIGNVLYHSWKK